VSSEARGSIDPARLENWIQIRRDNMVALRVGVSDFGKSTVSTTFRQIAPEEFRLPFTAIAELITGDTNETPDGGSGRRDALWLAHGLRQCGTCYPSTPGVRRARCSA
jgi:hypothetical protein